MAFSSSSTGRLPAKATKRGSFGPGAGTSPSSSYSSVQSVASVSSRTFGTKKKSKPTPPPPPPNVANVDASIGTMKGNLYRPGTKADLKGKENHHPGHASHPHRVPIDLPPTPFITRGGSVGDAYSPPTVKRSLSPPPPPEPAKVGLPSPTPRHRAQVATPSTSPNAPTSAPTSASTSPLSSSSATRTPAIVAGISGSDATPSQPAVSSSNPSVNNVLFEFGPKTFLTGAALGGVDDDRPNSPPRSRSGPSAPVLGGGGGGGGGGGSGKAAAAAGKKGDTRKTQKNTAGAGGSQAVEEQQQQRQRLRLEMAAALERAVNAGDPHAALRLADEAWTRVMDGMLAAPEEEKTTLVPLVAALMANVASAFDSLRRVKKHTARTQLCASSCSLTSQEEEQDERLQLLAAPRRTASGGYITYRSVGASRGSRTGRRFGLGATLPWLFALGGAGTAAARLRNP